MKKRILRFNLFLGLSILAGSSLLLAAQLPFMKNWFYCFAWWSTILIMDSLNFRIRNSSPLAVSTKHFIFTAFVSVFVWLIFELFNLRLDNWSYRDLPPSLFERWLGYFIAFASVVPAIWEFAFFIKGFFGNKKLGLFGVRVTPFLLKLFVFLGILFLVLTIGWPRLFFPLVWLGFIFLLEPLNDWLGNKTILSGFQKKDWSRFWSWVLAGLAAGFFWEFFNFWAQSRWEYSLPYLNFWRVFQMPVFGYTGFMPFALEIFAFHQLFNGLYNKWERRKWGKRLMFLVLILFNLGCFYLIDTFTLIK